MAALHVVDVHFSLPLALADAGLTSWLYKVVWLYRLLRL